MDSPGNDYRQLQDERHDEVITMLRRLEKNTHELNVRVTLLEQAKALAVTVIAALVAAAVSLLATVFPGWVNK